MKTLKAAIETLSSVRAEMHGKLENRTIERIDEVISDLIKLEDGRPHQYNPIQVLNSIGTVIELAKVIESLLEVLKWK